MDLHRQPVNDRDEWNALLTTFSSPHLLQSWEWGELKAGFGWQPERIAWIDPGGKRRAATQILYRSQRGPLPRWSLTLAYCPKGPALEWTDGETRRAVLAGLVENARQRGAFMLKIDPEVPVSLGPADEQAQAAVDQADLPGAISIAELAAADWRRSSDRVQFDNTILVDLTPEEDQILARMKQKTRYNVRLAQRHGVAVRAGGPEDLPLLFRMYAETSARDRFVIRDQAYYLRAWEQFMRREMAQPFIAEVEGEPVSGLIAYRFGPTAWYLYGMSRSAHREKMPNHLLQWEAMRWAKGHGCTQYDLVGIPGRPDPRDSLWGLYRFKVGFGGSLLRTIGAWDYPLRPNWYWLYQRVLPRVLAVMRSRGRRRTQALIE